MVAGFGSAAVVVANRMVVLSTVQHTNVDP